MIDLTLSQQLYERRKALRLRQADVAYAAGMTESRYQAYESGRQLPTVATLARILDALEVELTLKAKGSEER